MAGQPIVLNWLNMGPFAKHLWKNALILAFLTLPAWATSFIERPFPQTVQDSPVIVHGRVGPTYTDWGHESDGGKRIYTYWELEIVEVLKGSVDGAQGVLRMREMGGEKDGMGMQVPGSAQFNTGEDVVVFLSDKNSEGSYDVWGLMMGKLNVQKNGDGKEILSGPAINNLTHSRLLDDESHGDTPSASKWTLDALRNLVASQGSTPPPESQNPSIKRVVKSEPSAAPVVAPTPSETSSPVAPQLQTSSPEDSSFPSGLVVALGAGILVLSLFFIARKRR